MIKNNNTGVKKKQNNCVKFIENSVDQDQQKYLRTSRESSNRSISESNLIDSSERERNSCKKTLADNRNKRDGSLDPCRRTKSLYGASQNVNFGPKACIVHTQSAVLTIQDPSSQRLTWSKPPFTVLVIKKMFDASVIQPFVELVRWLISVKKMVVHVEKKALQDENLKENKHFQFINQNVKTFEEEKDNLTNRIDFVICLGGDGTLLYVSSLFQQSVPPVMAFHLGSLGFLIPFDFSDFKERVSSVLEGNAALTLRTRLKCVICKNESGERPCNADMDEFKTIDTNQDILVLNEVVLDRGPSSYLGNIDLYIEGKLVTSVQGDGIIIATPTGSTAYAAAAGASMLHPNIPAILITPICPHSLSFRPIVVPAGVEIRLAVSPISRTSAWVSFDGRNRQELNVGDSVRVTTSIYPVPSICASDQMSDWFDSLAGCLNWNVRKTQKAIVH